MTGVTLDTIGGGVLAELFAVELARILANIADPNMEAKAKRTMTLTVTFTPNRERDVADVTLTCTSKLAGIQTVDAQVFLGKHKGQLIAVESDPRQSSLFDQPLARPVVNGNFPQNEGA